MANDGPTSEITTLDRAKLEEETGALFGDLWPQYDEALFDASVELFHRRLEIAGVAPNFFAGKSCLDAGCGGGRASIAMTTLGAASVVGVDLGAQGLDDARRRAAARGLTNVRFEQGSLLDLPLAEESMDLVWCAGVLMHTTDQDRVLDELVRVLKKGGRLYLLVYATEGLRWPLIQMLRPLAAEIGRPALEDAVLRAGLPANKRRTFIDDLFCPVIDFFSWQRLEKMLKDRGCTGIERWGEAPRLDHEASLLAYREDLDALLRLFAAGASGDPLGRELCRHAENLVAVTLETLRSFEEAVAQDLLDSAAAMRRVIGQGHHRVWATKA